MGKKATIPRPERWDVEIELDLLRDLARKDFWFFFHDVFGAGANPKGARWVDENIHRPLCEWLQLHVDEWFASRETGKGDQKHLAVLIPRELGKTTLANQALQMWLHARDPELSSFTGCESSQLAVKILDGIKAVMDGSDPHSLFTTLFGDWSTAARSWSAKQATHAARKNTSRKDPSFGTFSVETSITGAHPDVIFYDDPISYERLTTDANWLDTVNSQITSLIPVLQSDGLMVWVGTRYDDGDHFGRAFKHDGVATLSGMNTDSIVPDPAGVWHVYFLSARDKEGKPTCEKVWPENRLKRYENTDPLRYAAQVLNDPNLSEGNPITREMLEKECVIPVKEVPWGLLSYVFLTDVAFWDGVSKARKDETVFIVMGYERNGSGNVYFIEGYGDHRWRGEDLAMRLVATAQRYRRQGRRVRAITGEVTMSGMKGIWADNLANYFHDKGEAMPQYIEFQRGGQNKKITRIVAGVQFIVDGRVKFVEGCPGLKQIIDQLCRVEQMKVSSRIPNDWVDAFSDTFQSDLYNPARMTRYTGRQKPPWEHGSKLLDVEGLDFESFKDDDWARENPREPIR